MALEQEKTITKRLRMSMKVLRLTMEELDAAVGQYNALGSAAFTTYGGSPDWSVDNPGLSIADFQTAVATLNTFLTTYGAGHNTNINKAQTPV